MLRSCPRRHARLAAIALAMTAVAACDHSDAFTTPDTRSDTPRTPGTIAQLTFNLRPDLAPIVTRDGAAVLYAFESGEADRDICLAALPVTGGTRTGEWCAAELDEATRADWFAGGALRADGALAYTRFGSLVFAPIPSSGALYVAPDGDLTRTRKVVDLLRLVPGIGILDQLVDPVWTGPETLTALAATANIARACNVCPWDTTLVGQAVVTINTSGLNDLSVIGSAAGVEQLALDASGARFVLRRGREILTMPTSGGVPTLVYDAALETGGPFREIPGVAAGGGRIFATRRWFDADTLRSDITILVNGTPERIPGTFLERSAWGRATATADGRRLIVERSEGLTGQSDLYLVEVPQ
ncbi:MAG TPA: hypothetical protein VFN90_05990 [Gemmatimonadales bacterium]|nr:hypothetical protein [Gemmatimonadales bacterium]